MSWQKEIAAIATGDNDRSIDWCAEELERATRQLVWDYAHFLAHLRHRRSKTGHPYDFTCCRAVRVPRGRPKREAA